MVGRKKLLAVSLLGSAVLVLGGIVAAIGIVVMRRSQPNNASPPESITKQVLFPIYDFTWLPPGYTVSQRSYELKDGALIFDIMSQGSQHMAVSEQPVPPGFDFQGFYNRQLLGAHRLSGTHMPAVVGRIDSDKSMVSVVSNTTWLIITMRNEQLSESDLIKIVNGLEEI